MRITVLFIGCLFFFSLLARGQNYQTVYPHQENCFANENGFFSCLRIDSLSEGNPVKLYPSPIHLYTGDQCYSPLTGSWIGKKIEIRESGENVFFNYAGQPVTIKTHAVPGDEWVAYEVPGELQIMASLVAHEEMDFLELTDSVKTIAFQAYDPEGDLLDMDVNGLQVKISKDHGWIQPLNFYFFPDFESVYPEMNLQELTLTGLSEPQMGLLNLTWFEVYDFQPGDVLHVLEEDGTWVGEEDGYFEITETRTIFEYLDRTDHNDSIEYTYVQKQRIHKQWIDSLILTHDTLTRFIKPNADFDELPYTAVPPYEGDEYHFYYFYDLSIGDFYQKTDRHLLFEKGYEGTDSLCWQIMIAWRVPSVKYYYKGLGGPYYPREEMHAALAKRKLVYFEKDGETWGTPLDVTSVEAREKPAMVKIFPNPARGSFRVDIDPSLSGEYSIKLLDVNSREVHLQKVNPGTTTINVSHLPPGIYFGVITGQQGVVHTHKLLLQ